MSSISDHDTAPADLSGDHGNENKMEILPRCCGEGSDCEKCVGCEVMNCDAGPCKKQRVTTHLPQTSHCRSDHPLVLNNPSNSNSSNINSHSLDGWNKEMDNLEETCHHGDSPSMVNETLFHGCLTLCAEIDTDNDKTLGKGNHGDLSQNCSSLFIENNTDPFHRENNDDNLSKISEKDIDSFHRENNDDNLSKISEKDIDSFHIENNDDNLSKISKISAKDIDSFHRENNDDNLSKISAKDIDSFHRENNDDNPSKISAKDIDSFHGENNNGNVSNIVDTYTFDGNLPKISEKHTDTFCLKSDASSTSSSWTLLREDNTNGENICYISKLDNHTVSCLPTDLNNSNLTETVSAISSKTACHSEQDTNECTSLENNCLDEASGCEPSVSLNKLKTKDETSSSSDDISQQAVSPYKNYDSDTRDLCQFGELLDRNMNCETSGSQSTCIQSNVVNCTKVDVLTMPAIDQKSESPMSFMDETHQDSSTSTNNFYLSNFSKIPFGILINIFRYLSLSELLHKVCLVCHHWHEAAQDPSLWRRVSLVGQTRLTDEVLDMVTSYSDRVLYLDITDCGQDIFTDAGIISVLRKCSNLRTFKMARYSKFLDDTFAHIGTCCPALRHLNLDVCYFSVTDKTLIGIGKGCPHLEYLYLSQCNLISDEGMVMIARGCPKLKQLRVDQCVKIKDKSLQELANGCPDIDYLHLLSCSLTDNGIEHLSKLLNLRMLDISKIQQLSSRCVEMMVRSCKKLTVLSVSLNRAVDDECIRVIVQECTNLKRFSCVACNITDKALEYMGTYSKTLEKVDVAWCGDITDEGVRFISEKLVSLEYLGLLQCRQITMETIEDLVEKYPHIHYSNFVLESRKLIEQAQKAGFKIPPIKDLQHQ
ncbi:uncharacterized protein LOC121373357 [Gigantopelta aegis]|uniref:uncharacterized protein LOC121373357 n=1 Tax=Gigantopelta aegis TaxID=1735272 RepID=UPI001B88C7D6|nr:uncharacterized protein LOC121373357 [Gigantopelta aegis]